MKQTLLEIKRRTNITTRELSEQSKIPIAEVFIVETGGYISKEKARQVITAFNQLSGMHLQVDDIRIRSR